VLQAFAVALLSALAGPLAHGPKDPIAMITIVALGDSTTAGTPLFQSPIEAPPNGRGNERSQFAYWLNVKHADWLVLNRGVNGERTDQIAARFDRDVLAAKPRIVILIAGVNDVYQGRSAESAIAALRGMYDRALGAGITVIAGSILPYNTATPDQNARMRQINAWIASQARADQRLVFVDTRQAVASEHDPDQLAGSPDGLHPNVDGYHHLADVLEPLIRRLSIGDR
jgi:lysophospholipase L1-like esterase